ncbi:MAG: hypothetical protein ACRBBN_10495 [Methyloligellaceae bacterium]
MNLAAVNPMEADVGNSDYILDLKEKVEAIIERLYDLDIIQSKTITDFANKFEIDYQNLKSCWKSGIASESYDTQNRLLKFGKIKIELQQKLADIGKFNLRQAPWAGTGIDNKTLYNDREDRVEKFKLHLQDVLTRETYYAGSTDFFLLIEAEPPENCETDFASLSLDGTGQDAGPGQTLQIFMENRFNRVNLSPVAKIGLQMVRLKFDKLKSSMTAPIRLGRDKDDKLTLDNVEIELGGSKWEPIWRFSVKDGFLSSLVTGDKPLCELANASEGSTITARLQTDLWETTIDHKDRDGDIEEDPLRQRLIEILEKKGAGLKPAEGGWVTLGTQRLHVIAKKSEGT